MHALKVSEQDIIYNIIVVRPTISAHSHELLTSEISYTGIQPVGRSIFYYSLHLTREVKRLSPRCGIQVFFVR